MRVLFVQNIWREYFGVMAVAATLRQTGARCNVLIENNPAKVPVKAASFNPDMIGFSFTNCEEGFAVEAARHLKASLPEIPIVFGGVHPTLSPGLLENSEADFLCEGEGDHALPELAVALERGSDVTSIGNIHAKLDGRIFKNPPRPLVSDLSILPFPDRRPYYRYNFLRNNPVKYFFTGRGCPHSCTFCFNSRLRKLYRGKGRYVRRFSVDWCIEEQQRVLRNYGARVIRFEDDLFVSSKNWISEFLPRYKEKIRRPFLCYMTARTDEQTIAMLAEAGCYCALFGIETGDENRRIDLLGKPVKNRDIENTARLLHKYNIHMFTSNMLALPGETLEDARKTVELNRRIGARDVWCSIYQPYAGLPLSDEARAEGLLDAEGCRVGCNTFSENRLNQPGIEQIFNLQKFFYPMVRWPALEPLILRLIRMKPNRIFHYVFLLFYALSYYQHSKAGFGRTLAEGFKWFQVMKSEVGRVRKSNQ